jgi:PAS domain S-box-containing protein
MKRFLMLLISFIVVLTAPLLHAAEAAEPSGQGTARQEILILNSYHPGYAWSDGEQAGIIDVFRAKDKNWLPVIEYLDLKRLPGGRHLAELKKLFRRKYQNQKFSVVIAMDNSALEFAIDNQAELFRNAPIVFCGINNYKPSMLKGRADVAGIAEAIEIAATIEVMLRLHPDAREIFVSHDYTVTGLAVRKEIEALVPRFSAKVRFRFADPLTMQELLKELERLPRNSLILEIGFITDKSGRAFGLSETTKLFYEHSPVPVYSTHEQRLGFGIVGGKLLSARIHGTNAARIALRVLAGEKPSAIPIVFENGSRFMFDYKVMNRFGIPLSALPEGSTVINKPVSYYAAYRAAIQTALGIIGILLIVISLLAVAIIQRRRSAIAIHASEAKYYDLYENAPDMFLSADAITAAIMECNKTLVNALGYAREEILGRSIFEMYHPDCQADAKRLFQQFTATGEIRDAELAIRRKDGGIINVSLKASAVRDKEGKITHSRFVLRDITGRKKAEEELRESEERLRFHTDNSPIAVVEWSTDFVVTRWTGAAEKMFGWSFEETIGKPIMELRMIYEEDIPIVQSVMQRLTDGKSKHVVSSNRNYTKKGEVIHCEWYNSVLHDSAGKMISAMSQVLDITGRKRAEEELRRSEENFRLSLVESPLGVRIVTKEGETIYANRAMLNIYRYDSIEELRTKPLKERYTPGSYAESQIRKERRGKGEYDPFEYEISIVRENGEVRHLQVFRQEILWDGERQIQTIYQDITDRKLAEEALGRSEENFRSSLDNSPLGVRIVAEEGDTIYANRAILDIYDFDSIEELNITPIKKRYTPESYAEFQIRKEKRKRGDYGPSEYEISTVRKDGEVRHLQVFRKKILWNGEEQFQVIYQDITERKRAEEALRVSREQMRALAGRLQAVREEERTNISREIHDELGGALTGLKIDFSLLTRTALKIENEKVRTALLAGMDSMTKFIDATIHTVRRIAMELRPGVLDDLGLVAALEWQLKDFERRTGIRCEFFPPVEDITFDADLSTALFRIFQEALTNVARHSGATEVRVRLRLDADSATLEVEDNGKGIEKEKTASKESLGLLGMRERTLMFGGRITVTGTPGIGTTVTIDTPPLKKKNTARDQKGDAG